MALAIKENYLLHKLHSLAGIVPVGYYLVQHLALNTFSLAGPEKFNGIIKFFEGMPVHFFWAVSAIGIFIPLIFHAFYGLFILSHAKYNVTNPKYNYPENRYFTLQRMSGIVAFLFLIYHVTTTTIASQMNGAGLIYYNTWQDRLSNPFLGIPYFFLAVYVIGVVSASYHFSYGIWSFCIRWGITISERSQEKMWKVSTGAFIAVSLLGVLALFGFFRPVLQHQEAAPLPGVDAAQSVSMR